AGGSGLCTDLSRDQRNCGACDRACPSGQNCVAGQCGPSCPVFGGTALPLGPDAGPCQTPLGDGGFSCCSGTVACGSACVKPGTRCADGVCDATCDGGALSPAP